MAIAADRAYGRRIAVRLGATRLRDSLCSRPEGKHMNPTNQPERRDTFGLLLRRRSVPIVETPSRWPWMAMGLLYLVACAFAGFLIFN